MRARAPASSANLGPGFDTLAVALDCYVSVEVEPADSLRVHTRGRGSRALRRRVAPGRTGRGRGARATTASPSRCARRSPWPGGWARPPPWPLPRPPPRGPRIPSSSRRPTTAIRRTRRPACSAGWSRRPRWRARPVQAPLPLSRRPGLRRHRPRAQPRHARGPAGAARDDLAEPTRCSTWAAWGCCWPAWPIRPAGRRWRRPTASTSRPARRCSPRRRRLLRGLVDAGALAASWSGAGPTLIGMRERRLGGSRAVRGRGGARIARRARTRPGAAGRPARHRLRRRGRGPAVGARRRSRAPVEAFAARTARCSWLIAALTLNVLSTWL